uniref:Carbonic anhydrase 4 n=1 Tax=Geotrypetes seraphini TaxID=260995 RepID=A0A6P8PS18_GEOSA|nr:carbonic anhydrase 4 [Geotrypetes seraphini]
MQSLLLLLSFGLHIFRTATAASWCYEHQKANSPSCIEPKEWSNVNIQCGGTQQSPIDIDTRNVEFNDQLIPFQFQGYENPNSWTLTNDGHSAKLTPKGIIQISGGNLKGCYNVLQLHLHWGNETLNGSEHTINGVRNPMELHIVHMNTKYANQEEALKKPDGLAVLGFLYKKTDQDNQNYKPFIEALTSIPNKGEKIALDFLSLKNIIPDPSYLSRYYRYNGSLTTPNCSEAVIWTLFEKTIPLSNEQLRAFFKTLYFPSDNDSKKFMSLNYRPTQNLGKRKIYTSEAEAVLLQGRVLLPVALTIFFMTFVCY